MTPEQEAYAAWSRRHGDLDPGTSAWVRGWIRLSHALARPLARRGISPDVVSAVGVLVTAGVVGLSVLGGGWTLLAVPLVVLAGLADGTDGAVAALSGRTSPVGRVVDAVADRVGDLLLALVLLVLGAPAWVVVAVVGTVVAHETVRSAAQLAGMHGPGAVTVAERPTRVIMAGLGVLATGVEWAARALGVDVLPAVDGPALTTAAAATWLALGLVGLAHLGVAVRRALA